MTFVRVSCDIKASPFSAMVDIFSKFKQIAEKIAGMKQSLEAGDVNDMTLQGCGARIYRVEREDEVHLLA